MDYAIYKERDGKNPHVVHRFTQETCNHKAKLAAREKLSEMWMRVLQRPYLCHNPKMEPGKIDGFRYDYMTSVNTSESIRVYIAKL